MGQEIVYCSRCGERILASEFDRGRAGTVQGKDYCRKCMQEAPGETEGTQGMAEPTSPPDRRTPEKPTRRPPGSPGTTRVRPADTSRRTLLIVGALVLAAVIVLAIIVLLNRGSSP